MTPFYCHAKVNIGFIIYAHSWGDYVGSFQLAVVMDTPLDIWGGGGGGGC